MKGIHIYFNNNYSLDTIDESEAILVQGDADSKALYFHFDGIIINDFACRVIFERADGSESGQLIVSTDIVENYYQYLLPSWVTEQEGNLKVTVILKQLEVIAGYGIANLVVNEAVTPSEITIEISQVQYDAILTEIETLKTRVQALEDE